MKKFFALLFLAGLLSAHQVCAEEPSPVPSESPEVNALSLAPESPAPSIPSAPDVPADVQTGVVTPTETTAPVPSAAPGTALQTTDSLEFVSGEVTGMDETAKTITVKLYGETENSTNDKILTVNLDETTDITDGEKDRDIKSLTNGTEVDVEYDPANNKATYIFVY